ncbi:MAG TPA: hypothetical protein PLG21_19350, partial [Anaerolineae bacterium]|nr:hypothetical protein [Anaerolineae bacterium]
GYGDSISQVGVIVNEVYLKRKPVHEGAGAYGGACLWSAQLDEERDRKGKHLLVQLTGGKS